MGGFEGGFGFFLAIFEGCEADDCLDAFEVGDVGCYGGDFGVGVEGWGELGG